MDFGLYTLKMPFRKLISWLVPLCQNISPNWISIWLLPWGLVIAANYYYAPQFPVLYLLGVFLILIRFVIATLDGMVAIEYKKSSAEGELLNRITPEIADVMMLLALLAAHRGDFPIWCELAIFTAWLSSFFGLIGLAAGRAIQSVGPVGQTDRLAALVVFSLLEYGRRQLGSDFNMMHLFFEWLVVGGLITIVLRCQRNFRS